MDIRVKPTSFLSKCFVFSACLSLSVGCHGGLSIPIGWNQASSHQVDFADNSTRRTDWDESGEPGRLQVIICYGRVFSNHAALRLTCPGKRVLFWDPGGYYGEKDPSAGRDRDLILLKPPTLRQWWRYRKMGCKEPFMLVFEWELPAVSALSLHHALLSTDGHTGDSSDRFQRDAPGLFCCIAVCDYLQRFASSIIDVPRRWLMPHDLGQHLWSQSPHRVYLFREKATPCVLVPDPLVIRLSQQPKPATGSRPRIPLD